MKKIPLMIAALLASFTLVGCGGSDDSASSAAEAPAPAEQSTMDTAESMEEVASDAVEAVEEAASDVMEAAEEVVEDAQEAVDDAMGDAEAAEDSVEEVKNALDGMLPKD